LGHRLYNSAAAALAALGLLAGGAGCAGDGPASGPSEGGFAEIQREIFDSNCISGSCHNLVTRAGNLVLVEGESHRQLLDSPTDNPAARDAGLARVTPFEPDVSFLLIKLLDPEPAQGSRMPLSASPLSAAQIDSIREWIAAGALEFDGLTPTPSSSPTPSATATATSSATRSASPTTTSTPTVTRTATATPSGTLPPTPSATSTATATPTPSSTAAPSATATPTFNETATLANIQSSVFNASCLDQFCHTAQDRAGNLALEEGLSFTQLVGATSFNLAARQAGLLRVAGGDPERSFLLIKLLNPSLPQGSKMPLGKPPLAGAEIGLIRDWISQGALP
jgi:hypothetical protein